MPIRLEDGREMIEDGVEEVQKRTKKFWYGFSSFALQDNVLEFAMGLIIATAFTAVVTSFVSEVLLPPLSLLPFLNKNLDEKFAVLRRGAGFHHNGTHGYNTLDQALSDGAVVMAYGTFVNKVVNFMGVGIALYTVASIYEWFSNDSIIKCTVKCKYCRKRISERVRRIFSCAKRCVNCTSWLDGREDR
ncbi:putative ion channel [Calycina marina]|uniref:Ion channel n=1 Tax=Calycina marina TaxID=1763456 RepID=A0A9P7Z0K9_9HELO|nr:putative ion channel [Calycina marina]